MTNNKNDNAPSTYILGYARVSTAGQSTDNQVAALREAGCTEIFIDEAVSGSRNHHSPVYRDLMDRVRELREAGHFVIVKTTKLDRFSRSTQHLLEGITEIADMGASFETLSGGFGYDARNSAVSMVMLTVFAALAEFERKMITERMAEGKAVVKSKGMIFGRKPVLNLAAVKAIRRDYATGTTTDRKLASEWGVARTTIQRVLGINGFTEPYVSLDEWEAAKAKAKLKS